MVKKVQIYLAGPLFTQAEWLWNANLAKELRALNFDIILPQATAEPMLYGKTKFSPQALFDENIAGINQADIILAVLDHADPDSGTCWECGYAFKLGKPIIGLRTDIRPGGDDPAKPVNLMLSISCKEFLKIPLDKRDDLPYVTQHVAGAITRVYFDQS